MRPWHLLAQVKGLSSKRIKTTRLKNSVERGEGEETGENRERQESLRTKVCTVCLTEIHVKPRSWGVKTCLFCGGRSKREFWLGRCDAREAGYPSAALTLPHVYLFCQSQPPQLTSLTPSYTESLFSPYIIHLNVSICVCALLTFDILLDLLAEWPRGFSFCKRGDKQKKTQWVKTATHSDTGERCCIATHESWYAPP